LHSLTCVTEASVLTDLQVYCLDLRLHKINKLKIIVKEGCVVPLTTSYIKEESSTNLKVNIDLPEVQDIDVDPAANGHPYHEQYHGIYERRRGSSATGQPASTPYG
jgi:hypothetical protein